MKKVIFLFISLIIVFGMVSCSSSQNTGVINTFEVTPLELIEEYVESSKEVTSIKYYELSDGTWKTDEYDYKYKLAISGRLGSAVTDITYIILSNNEDITFEQAWKASGLSSNLEDYFNSEDAIIVATKMG